MLRLFKNNSPFSVIILFIFALVVKFKVLFHPLRPFAIKGHIPYNYILKGLKVVLGSGAFAYSLLAVIMLFIQALYLNNVTIRHKLFPRNTYISAFVYLLLTSIYPHFSYFSETLILNWILIGAMDTMFSFSQTSQPRKVIYNAAMLLCIAGLFQFTFLVFFFLLLIGLVMFRTFNTGEWSVALLGYFTPIYFLASILFLTDRFYMLKLWPQVAFTIPKPTGSPLYFGLTIAGVGICLFAGIIAMQRNVSMSNIYVRRDWSAISFYLIIAGMVAFATSSIIKSSWLVTMPPLSIIAAHAFSFEKNKRFSNFIFYFSIIFLVFCLWANK